MNALVSHDPQTVIRTARRTHRCDCHLPAHAHVGGHVSPSGSRFCPNVIQRGDRYPEYLGESPEFQSGKRYCPDCRKDQLGDWIEEVEA